MSKRLLLLGQWLLLIMVSPALRAQNQCSITLKGKVVDAHTREPIAFASVAILDQDIGTLADENGNYILPNLCAGTYVLVCSHVGCHHAQHEFEIKADMSWDFELEEVSIVLQEVVVSEEAPVLEATQSSSTLDAAQLQSERGLSLGDAMSQLPGVTTLNTGATIAKPVIQGLHSNRVLILNNGVRQEGQQWGSEHAPEIDPFLADKVTVIKGASSVRYGADAIGGVVLVEPRPLPQQAGIGGEANLQAFSNGRVGIASGMLEGRLKGKLPLSGRLQGTVKRGGNLQTPGYYLDNTGVEELNFSWAVGLQQKQWSTEAFYSRFYTQLGIFSGSHIGNLTDL
ncbi:MAG: TonB-dependent receptor, partial [Phaeodactylibacter sp.]|nr:TonB-dependent receptor [Phaeodactylibacter sp.]